METKRIFNLIVLDASGSMESIYQQALSGVNETIQTIRKGQEDHPELHQFLTLASFNAGENYLHRIYNASPITQVKDITPEDYRTTGCTALYDAMGDMISEMQQKASHEDAVLVTVITDGYENSSHRWSRMQIKSIVQELRQQGWTFNYIGANQDVDRVADGIGIANKMSFATTAEGTDRMFRRFSLSSSAFFNKVSSYMACEAPSELAEDLDFFIDEEEQES